MRTARYSFRYSELFALFGKSDRLLKGLAPRG